MEQKAAVNTNVGMSEYTNPGPVENSIYVPSHDQKGQVTIQTVGGDVDAGKLTDLEYFQNKLFGALRVPKAYFGITDDGAGFNGGQSLAIISSRYAKLVKRIQATLCQLVTDILNLRLLDRGLSKWVNKFNVKMQAPTTQEEIDRRDNLSSKVQIVSDVMNLVNEIEDQKAKLEILKSLLSNVITNDEIISIIQGVIDELEEQGTEEQVPGNTPENEFGGEPAVGGARNSAFGSMSDVGGAVSEEEPGEVGGEEAPEGGEVVAQPELPSPSDLGIGDLSDNTTEI